MERLSIFHAWTVGSKDFDAIDVELFPGVDEEDATVSFKTRVFKNQFGMIYDQLETVLDGNDEWRTEKRDYSDAVRIKGEAQIVPVPAHYRFETNKNGDLVKASPERVVRKVRLVAFNGTTIEAQKALYLARIPKECLIDDEE